jgi:hypothetical protein
VICVNLWGWKASGAGIQSMLGSVGSVLGERTLASGQMHKADGVVSHFLSSLR